MTLADKILNFTNQLTITEKLPDHIGVLNPFRSENEAIIWPVVTAFYKKFYADNATRKLILGINPGRLGAGSTGLPFTDTKRLNENCDISFSSFTTHEPSSVFIYDVITAFGGPSAFYSQFYIGSVCPLGFVTPGKNGMVNINYYDDKVLQEAVTPFIVKSIEAQLQFGLQRDKIFVLGTGKNFAFLKQLNAIHHFAEELVPLEHPRFIMQYRARSKEAFITKYVHALSA